MATHSNKPARRILLTGKTGQIGHELLPFLDAFGDVRAPDSTELDLARPDALRTYAMDWRPQLIVNAAAYTAVDRAEEERDRAMAVNGTAPSVLAACAAELGAALVHYSTDYVFDGAKHGFYKESDEPNPMNVYGITKATGDAAIQKAGIPHLIFRTSWVYGLRGHNFLLTLQRLAREQDEVRVVNDQIGSPTWSRLVAQTTANVLDQTLNERQPEDMSGIEKASGIYNLTCTGSTSWYGFAQAILESLPEDERPRLKPIPTSEYPTPAPRPANSVLAVEKLRAQFGILLPDWQGALTFCLNNQTASDPIA
ncbi:dTDP-4-dehydrorhamnose reductase [Nitrospina watsonii]|uniref:dTDP-4-dehydrorhamnose reductase n=1 Tax=Nitrospina watsonii TaxID=1323948 RepID=A0ABN8VZB6_9BACT|nr:dTDP-4-dehydrorhamnose reductase [Nitrospina watsonii]CAI2717488.1 dTDP-4-dehydrorhamnose reductase [Nitrospina watsonii]